MIHHDSPASSRPVVLPGEWVLGIFLTYAATRLLVADHPTLHQGSIPRLDFFVVCLLVFSTRAFVEYRRTPWPDETRATRRLHLVFLALFVLFLPVILPKPPALVPEAGWVGGATDLFIDVYGWLLVVLLVVMPFALFWFAGAQHIKEHGRLDTITMIRRGWRPSLGTLRDWVPLLALIYFYGLMNPVIGRGLFGDQDALLARLDRSLFFGRDPRVLCEALISRPLSEYLSACYVFYLPLFPIVLTAVFAKRDPAPFRELSFALAVVFASGYVLYTIVPAQGPLFMDHFDVNLDAYVGAHFRAQLMDRTRVPRDCFPSLHTAASFTALWGTFRHARRLFWILAPIVLSIPFACVYLRYHYVVDILAGWALFGIVATWTTKSTWLQASFHRGSTAAE